MKIEEFEKLTEAETPVLVDFFSTSCDPCRWVLPVLDEIHNHFKNNLRIIKINVENADTLRQKFNIRSVPTLILFKQGKILWRIAGFEIAPVMIASLEKHLTAY